MLGEIQKTCLFNSEGDCYPSLYSFTNNERSLKCTTWSLRLLEGTMQPFNVFVTNKFMSSCVICLVIATENFQPQADCSVITKVHDRFRYYFTELTCFQSKNTNIKNGGHFIQIGYSPTQTNLWSFSSWMSVLTANFSDFQRLKHLPRVCCWFEWLEAQFQNATKFFITAVDCCHIVEKKRCKSEFHRHSFRCFSSASSHVTKGKPLFLYSFCDLRINVCVSATFVYFILNPTVTPSSDKSSGLSLPFSFLQAFFATCKNKNI